MTSWALDGGGSLVGSTLRACPQPLPLLGLSFGCFAPHQTSHLCCGFMGEPGGQRKCSENSFELETEPMTRKREGLWGSVMRPSWVLSGVRTEHQTFVRATEERAGSLRVAGLALSTPTEE